MIAPSVGGILKLKVPPGVPVIVTNPPSQVGLTLKEGSSIGSVLKVCTSVAEQTPVVV
jgi:hypothetical protein